MDLVLLKDVIIVFLTVIAIVISIATFIRQKTFENENHFFKYKLEKYNTIIEECFKLTSYYRETIDKFFIDFRSRKLVDSEVHAAADEIDLYTDRFQDRLLTASAFLPKSIVEQVEKFLDLLYDNDIIVNLSENDFKRSNSSLNGLDDFIEELSERMRKDLGVDVLDKRLEKRTRK